MHSILARRGCLCNRDAVHVPQCKRDMTLLCHASVHAAGAHCVQCQQEHSLEHVRRAVSRGKTKCVCKSCGKSRMYAVIWYDVGWDTINISPMTNSIHMMPA